MKYFKHDLKAFQDDKIWEVIEVHGMQAYGVWWWLLEQLYAEEDQGFTINSTETWFKKASKAMNLTDWRTLVRTLDTFSEVGLINNQLWADSKIFVDCVPVDIKERRSARRLSGYQKHRDKVFSRDGHRCVYCGSKESLTLDHVIPQSKGGGDEPDNLACCCSSCNSSKGAKSLKDWWEGSNEVV